MLTTNDNPSGLNLPSTIGVSRFGYYIGIANSLKTFRMIPSLISQSIALPSKSPNLLK